MKWHSQYKHPDNWHFIIEDGGNAGYYLYIYEDFDLFNEDIEDPDYCSRHQQDHLQDTFEMAKSYALKYHGVPGGSWIKSDF